MDDDDSLLRGVLLACRRVAIVGLSADASRPSFQVAQYLLAQGYQVFPVNPRHAGSAILGQPCVASLAGLREPVDLVDVFRRTEHVLPLAEQAVALGVRGLWQQIGVVNQQADALARAAGLFSVMDRCMKVEHARLIGAPH